MTSWQNVKITLKLARLDDHIVALLVVRLTEKNIIDKGLIANPGRLLDVRHGASDFNRR